MTKTIAWLRPRLARPNFPPKGISEQVAFWLGTGFGSGLLRPASGTWGSLVGMGYLLLWARLPGLFAQSAFEIVALGVSIWSAGVCERLYREEDPSSVVIDEIVVVPFAFFPLLQFSEDRWWMWVLAFVLYRVMDILKLWPGRRLEHLGGGLGIVADDVSSAIYTGLLLWGLEAMLH